MNKPAPVLLETLAKEVASGTLQSRIGGIVGFADLPDAIERHRTASGPGKSLQIFHVNLSLYLQESTMSILVTGATGTVGSLDHSEAG